MQPPSLKRVDAAEYEDAEPWFLERFLPLLNSFFGDVVANLDRGLGLENLRREERVLEFTTNSNVTQGAVSPWPLVIVPQKVRRPENVYMSRVENVTDSSSVGISAGAVQPWWIHGSKGEVVVRFITGLNVDTKYRLRFVME